MTYRGLDRRRTLIPRWRASNEAANAGELSISPPKSAVQVSVAESPHFAELVAEWSWEKSIDVAADLVSSGVALGLVDDRAVEQAARFIERSGVLPELKSLARRVLEKRIGKLPDSQPISFDPDLARAELQSQIATHKRRIRDFPRNAIAWSDLSRLYASLGQREKATGAIRMAIRLAPDNRFVLRSAARFFVHAGEEKDSQVDEGLQILRRSRLLREDPWIMSAEISLSAIAGESPRSYKRAKTIADADNLRPWDLSELNGALGTLAIEQGGVGKPSKLFNRSLREPTENALAQAQWASETNTGIKVPQQSFDQVRAPAFEALALKHRSEGQWIEVISDCRAWSVMEPTSTRPLTLGGFVAEVALEDGELAREFSERARLLDPNAFWPTNNLAVALAYLGRIAEAEKCATRFRPEDLREFSHAAYWATRGLIEYRRGNREQGLELYLKAAHTNVATKQPSVRAMVMWHLLREEARIGAPGIIDLSAHLWKRTDSAGVPELMALRDRLANPGLRERAATIVKSVLGNREVESMRERISRDLDTFYDSSADT